MQSARQIYLVATQILGVCLMLLDVTAEGGQEAQSRLHCFCAPMGFKPLLPARSVVLPLRVLPFLQPGG
jgi:hypothetical protein